MSFFQSQALASRICAASVSVLAVSGVLFLVGCAPEPVPANETVMAGQPTKGQSAEEGSQDQSWSQPVDEFDPAVKNTSLPESFPVELVQFPETFKIVDTGSYTDASWFVVLESASLQDAESQVTAVADLNDFSVVETVDSADGGVYGSLTGASVTVEYLTVPNDDHTALLSLVVNLAQ